MASTDLLQSGRQDTSGPTNPSARLGIFTQPFDQRPHALASMQTEANTSSQEKNIFSQSAEKAKEILTNPRLGPLVWAGFKEIGNAIKIGGETLVKSAPQIATNAAVGTGIGMGVRLASMMLDTYVGSGVGTAFSTIASGTVAGVRAGIRELDKIEDAKPLASGETERDKSLRNIKERLGKLSKDERIRVGAATVEAAIMSAVSTYLIAPYLKDLVQYANATLHATDTLGSVFGSIGRTANDAVSTVKHEVNQLIAPEPTPTRAPAPSPTATKTPRPTIDLHRSSIVSDQPQVRGPKAPTFTPTPSTTPTPTETPIPRPDLPPVTNPELSTRVAAAVEGHPFTADADLQQSAMIKAKVESIPTITATPTMPHADNIQIPTATPTPSDIQQSPHLTATVEASLRDIPSANTSPVNAPSSSGLVPAESAPAINTPPPPHVEYTPPPQPVVPSTPETPPPPSVSFSPAEVTTATLKETTEAMPAGFGMWNLAQEQIEKEVTADRFRHLSAEDQANLVARVAEQLAKDNDFYVESWNPTGTVRVVHPGDIMKISGKAHELINDAVKKVMAYGSTN